MEPGVLKQEGDRLKREIISNIEARFIDQYDTWKKRQELFNEVILRHNITFKKRLKPLKYDEFCKVFIRATKVVLSEYIKVDSIIPNEKDIESIRHVLDNDANAFRERYIILLKERNRCMRSELARDWNHKIFKEMIQGRYGNRYYEDIMVAKREVLQSFN